MTDFLGIEKIIESIRALAKEKAKRQRALDMWFYKEIVRLFVKYFGLLIREVRRDKKGEE